MIQEKYLYYLSQFICTIFGRVAESSTPHELKSGIEIRKNYNTYQLTEFEGEAVAQICEAHAKEETYSIELCDDNYGIDSISDSGRTFDLQKYVYNSYLIC